MSIASFLPAVGIAMGPMLLFDQAGYGAWPAAVISAVITVL
ncbi:hypothetical protein ACFVWF_28005 [Rhodococcus qingshengii]